MSMPTTWTVGCERLSDRTIPYPIMAPTPVTRILYILDGGNVVADLGQAFPKFRGWPIASGIEERIVPWNMDTGDVAAVCEARNLHLCAKDLKSNSSHIADRERIGGQAREDPLCALGNDLLDHICEITDIEIVAKRVCCAKKGYIVRPPRAIHDVVEKRLVLARLPGLIVDLGRQQ